jgi:hypothetical protein
LACARYALLYVSNALARLGEKRDQSASATEQTDEMAIESLKTDSTAKQSLLDKYKINETHVIQGIIKAAKVSV